jgi:hypothetical protein
VTSWSITTSNFQGLLQSLTEATSPKAGSAHSISAGTRKTGELNLTSKEIHRKLMLRAVAETWTSQCIESNYIYEITGHGTLPYNSQAPICFS